MKKTLSIIVFCFVVVFAQAQNEQAKVWTLQDCIDQALKHNLQVKQNQVNADLAKYQLEQSAGAMLPTLNGGASQSYNAGRNIDPYTNTFIDSKVKSNNFSIRSGLPIFEGLQLQNSLQQSRYNFVAGKYDVEKSKNDITLSVINAYLQILYNKELLMASQAQLEVSKNQLVRTQKLVAVGNVPRGNLLDAESQAANEELNVITAQNQLDLSYLTLVQLLDFSSVKGFEIVDPQLMVNVASLDYSTDSIYNFAVKNQPDVKSADLKLKAANYGLKAARGAYSPTLSLNASLSTVYSDNVQTLLYQTLQGPFPIGYVPGVTPQLDQPVYSYQQQQQVVSGAEQTSFHTQLNNNLSKSISLSLSIPILNGFQTQVAVKRAKANLEGADLTAQQTKLTLSKTIQQSYADASAALKKYNATAKALESQTEALKYAQQKFDVGMVTSVDYMTAKTNLNRSQANLLQAKYDYILKTKVLDFYMGKPLTF